MTLKNPKTCPRCLGPKSEAEQDRRYCSPCVLRRIIRYFRKRV